MKYSLEGKKVLFVAPRFFGYEQDIRDELIRRGAQVDFLLDRPFDTPLLKAVTRLRRNLVIGHADRYYREQLDALKVDHYDYVFVVNGQTLSSDTLSQWRVRYPRATFLLYMWDSFGNRRWAIENIQYFHHVFTFDRGDAETHDLHFRPLFFSAGFEDRRVKEVKWDVSFIGTAHTDRFSIIAKVSKYLPSDVRTYFYLYLQAKWVYWLYKVTNPGFRSARLSDFKFSSIAKQTVQEVFNTSACILDIEHPKQSGLTMRTLETLGAEKKLITTNQNVRDYDFFDERNICVIDRQAPLIPADFLASPYVSIAPEVYGRYRLSGWMDEILEVTQR